MRLLFMVFVAATPHRAELKAAIFLPTKFPQTSFGPHFADRSYLILRKPLHKNEITENI